MRKFEIIVFTDTSVDIRLVLTGYALVIRPFVESGTDKGIAKRYGIVDRIAVRTAISCIATTKIIVMRDIKNIV